jgi:glycosyltransferase involved in cell wall biosynthesis
MWLADIILFDTNQHIKYATEEFGVRKEKFRRIFVGAEDTIFFPFNYKKHDRIFLVEFHGTYIPLQGIEFIVRTAKEIEEHKDIRFVLIGSGQEKKRILELVRSLDVKNIEFLDFLSKKELTEKIAEADICLGIFGKTQKTQRVIPNKLYECAAMKKPIITADTPAIRELFDDRDLMLVKPADSEALADGILILKNNLKLREELAQNCFNKFLKSASPKVLGEELKKIIISIL